MSMGRKVQKTFTLDLEVVKPLEDEDVQSAKVEELLREEYDV